LIYNSLENLFPRDLKILTLALLLEPREVSLSVGPLIISLLALLRSTPLLSLSKFYRLTPILPGILLFCTVLVGNQPYICLLTGFTVLMMICGCSLEILIFIDI
jgi:hypothetical protein